MSIQMTVYQMLEIMLPLLPRRELTVNQCPHQQLTVCAIRTRAQSNEFAARFHLLHYVHLLRMQLSVMLRAVPLLLMTQLWTAPICARVCSRRLSQLGII